MHSYCTAHIHTVACVCTPMGTRAHSHMHLAASDEVHCPLHVHTTPVVEDIADGASTVDKAHVTLLTTGSKAEAVETDGKGGEWMEYSGERRVVRRGRKVGRGG